MGLFWMDPWALAAGPADTRFAQVSFLQLISGNLLSQITCMEDPMRLSRRSILRGGAASGALLVAGVGEVIAQDRPQLAIPELIDLASRGQSAELTVQTGRTEFFPGRVSRTLGYNGGYLGPTLRVRRGDDVEFRVTNTLGENTTVHWHGLLVPAQFDGSPHQVIRPGEVWLPQVTIRQPAATLFYHSHVHGRTAEQVYFGLAGVLLVADDEERALGLPSDYGVDDLPIVLQDRAFENGRLVLPGGMPALMHGRRGDTILANGVADPIARVPAGLVRLRLVNGSNARIYDLSFSDERTFHWIASEGGLLEAPVAVKSLPLSPGQRTEVLVDFSNGANVALQTRLDDNFPMMMPFQGGFRRFGEALFGSGTRRIVSFEPPASQRSAAAKKIPVRLIARKPLDASRATRRRRFTLTMGMRGMMGRMMGGPMGERGGIRDTGFMGINGRPFEMDRIDERIRMGDAEIWEVAGEMMSHPFHIHGVHFEVLSRDGRKPGVQDQGLRDTVLVDEPVELLVLFDQPAEQAPFMYHCHILEHEDNGMMGQFLTT